MPISPPRVTVIIPTRNEAGNIQTFLKSLPENISLIVVDSSNDDTVALIRAMRPQKTRIIEQRCNIPQARQLGAEAADTPWLLFSDADILFDHQYFEQLEAMTVHPKTGAIMGAKLSRDRYKIYLRLYSLSIGIYARFGLPMGSGSNMLIRREAFLKTSGFDPRLSAGEDTYMLWQVKRSGYKVIYNGKLRVYETDHRRLEKGIIRKIFHGTARALMLFSGIGKNSVRKSDWGYWQKEKNNDI